jgi:hypothetical protein
MASRLRAQDVFTPGSYPEYTYVQRGDLNIEQQLRDALDAPGQLVSISGPSKSGKTVLVERIVGRDNLITVTGSGIKTGDDLWNRVLDAIGEPNQVTAQDVKAHKGAATVGAKGSVGIPLVAKGEVSFAGTLESGEQQATGIVANRRGLAQVAKEIAKSTYVVLVDDFHYIDRDAQGVVAQAIKEAVRQEVKIVTAAVTHRSDDVLRSLADLRGRVINLDLRYWDKDSLIKIAHLGFERLNIAFDEVAIGAFANEAAGSPQLMQAICLAACQEMGLREARVQTEAVACSQIQLRAIFERIVTATNYRTLVDILAAGPKTRGTERLIFEFRDGTKGDVYKCILRAIAANPLRQTFPYQDIQSRVTALCTSGGLKPVGSAITGSCGQIARLAIDTQPEERVIDWDDEKSVLDVPDPYLLFYLRWSGHLEN